MDNQQKKIYLISKFEGANKSKYHYRAFSDKSKARKLLDVLELEDPDSFNVYVIESIDFED